MHKIVKVLQVHFFFLGQQFFYCFLVHFVGYTAIHRANGRTLGLFVETLAFGAFIGRNIISVNA